jgi:hypothetical protein
LIFFLLSPSSIASEHIATRISEASAITDIEPEWDAAVFEIFLNGEIRAGDRDAIASAISTNQKSANRAEKIRLHLDSPGGDYEEAVRIADELWKTGVTTSVDSGAKCHSACAIVFMSGRELGYEGPPSLSRFLHVRGELGFHAPYLPTKSCGEDASLCTFPLQLVSQIYRAAMLHISGLLLGSTNAKWPPDLVGKMPSKGPSDLLYPETVEDAGRWHIELFGFKAQLPLLDKKRATLSCFNAHRWSNDNIAEEHPLTGLSADFIAGWSKQTKKARRVRKLLDSEPREMIDIYTVTIDNMNNLGCTIVHSLKSGKILVSTRIGDMDGAPWPSWKVSHPKVKLLELPLL